MANHFSSIGFRVESQEDLQTLAERLLPKSAEIAASNGRYLLYSSPCGAQLWFQIDRSGSLVGLTPGFAAASALKVGVTAVVARPDDTPLEGALYAWADPASDEPATSGLYPFVFDCADYGSYGPLTLPFICDARIAAFAHELSVYATVGEYDESQPEEGGLASQSFIPSGLFSPGGGSIDPPDSKAILTGHVRSADQHTNPTTGERYLAAVVDTYGGSFHLVADPELATNQIIPGGVVSGSFWLCGRLVEPPPLQPKKGVLRRLFDRRRPDSRN